MISIHRKVEVVRLNGSHLPKTAESYWSSNKRIGDLVKSWKGELSYTQLSQNLILIWEDILTHFLYGQFEQIVLFYSRLEVRLLFEGRKLSHIKVDIINLFNITCIVKYSKRIIKFRGETNNEETKYFKNAVYYVKMGNTFTNNTNLWSSTCIFSMCKKNLSKCEKNKASFHNYPCNISQILYYRY